MQRTEAKGAESREGGGGDGGPGEASRRERINNPRGKTSTGMKPKISR